MWHPPCLYCNDALSWSIYANCTENMYRKYWCKDKWLTVWLRFGCWTIFSLLLILSTAGYYTNVRFYCLCSMIMKTCERSVTETVRWSSSATASPIEIPSKTSAISGFQRPGTKLNARSLSFWLAVKQTHVTLTTQTMWQPLRAQRSPNKLVLRRSSSVRLQRCLEFLKCFKQL